MRDSLNRNEVHRLLENKGKRGLELLSLLGKQGEFVDALDSPIGKALLKDLLNLTEDNLRKIINEDADDKVRAEYRVGKQLLMVWTERISVYEKNLQTALKGGKR